MDDFGVEDFLNGYEPRVLEDLADYGAGIVPGTNLPSLREQENMFPTFALNYVSMKKGRLCFDNPLLSTQKFFALLSKCKELNETRYWQLIDSAQKVHRFHIVEPFRLKRCSVWNYLCQLWNITAGSREENELPDIYQFGLYTDEATAEAPRVLGFVGRWGVFYLLWFDVDHQVYPQPVKATPAVLTKAPAQAAK